MTMESAAEKLVEWVNEQVRLGRAQGMSDAQIKTMVAGKIRQFNEWRRER